MKRAVLVTVIVIIAALAGSFVVVRGKLALARREIARLQDALHTRQTPAGQVQAAAMMVGILRPVSNVTVRSPGEPVMLAPRAQAATAVASAAEGTPAETTEAAGESAEPVSNAVAEAGVSNAPAEAVEKPIAESDLARAVGVMAEDWKRRRTELENKAIAAIGLNAEQSDTFRKIMADMNVWMQPKVEEWTNRLQSASVKVAEEPCVQIVNELSGIMIVTYKEMDRRLGASWRSKVPKNFTLTDFIDPSIGIPMVDAQRLLRERQ